MNTDELYSRLFRAGVSLKELEAAIDFSCANAVNIINQVQALVMDEPKETQLVKAIVMMDTIRRSIEETQKETLPFTLAVLQTLRRKVA